MKNDNGSKNKTVCKVLFFENVGKIKTKENDE
jgi:hypothetical protein